MIREIRPPSGSQDPPDKPTGPLGRIKAIPSRTKLLLVVGLLLALVFFGVGPFRGCSGVSIPEDEAIATARAQIDFEPEKVEAKVLRQGLTTAWIVVFTISAPDGGRDECLRRTDVRINASTGEFMDEDDHPPDPESGLIACR